MQLNQPALHTMAASGQAALTVVKRNPPISIASAKTSIQVGAVHITAKSRQTSSTFTQQFDQNATQSQNTMTTTHIDAMSPTTDFLHALADQPNTYVYSSGIPGLNGSNISINGFGNNELAFTLDGIPINDADNYGFYSNEFIPLSETRQITVAPGAGSATTIGMSAFGGSVGTASKNPSPHFFVKPMGGHGSGNTYNYGAKMNSGLIFAHAAPTAFYAMRNITRSGGVFTHTPAKKFTTVFKSLTQLGPGALTLFYSGNNQRFNYYGGATQAERAQYGDNYSGYNENPGSSRYYGYNYNDYKNSISYIKYGFALGSAQISNQYYYYSGDGFGAGAGVSKSSLYLKKSWNITHRWGDIVKADIPLKHARVEMGLWYQRDRGHHYQDRYTPSTASHDFAYDELVHTHTATPYAQVKIDASRRLIVTPGMKYLFVRRRFDNHIDHSSHTVAFREWLPSLGVNYALSPTWRLYANYTRNANPPAYNQFYSGQFNPDLKPQIANTIEMGGYWKANRWSGRATLFHTAFRNYILTTLVQEGSQTISQLSNAGNAVHEGASVNNNYQFLPWLSGFFNVGFLHAQLTSANQPVPYAAHHTESLGINIHRGKLRASFAVRETGKRYVNLGGAFVPIGSAVSADASVSYRLSRAPLSSPGYGLKNAALKLTISNVFDRRNTLSLSGAASDPRYTLQAPRTVYASIEARF